MHGLLTMCTFGGREADVVSSLQALEDKCIHTYKSLTQTRPWEQNFATALGTGCRERWCLSAFQGQRRQERRFGDQH